MSKTIGQELSSLLAATEDLLHCPEPELEAWGNYSKRRQELFRRLQPFPLSDAEAGVGSAELRDLIALVLEKDRQLVRKIRHHLSNFSREMAALKDARRVLKAYASNAKSALSMPRVSA